MQLFVCTGWFGSLVSGLFWQSVYWVVRLVCVMGQICAICVSWVVQLVFIGRVSQFTDAVCYQGIRQFNMSP